MKEQLPIAAMPEILGSSTWARTRDLRINSPALYRLSYRGTRLRLYTQKLAAQKMLHRGVVRAGSGRRQSHASTQAMHRQASAKTQRGVCVKSRIAALAAIIVVAAHFERRLTCPPRDQSRSIGPNRRWCHSQRYKGGELRAAAQAAIKMKTVDGRPGKKIPTMPSARQTSAKPLSSHCTGSASGLGAVGGSSSGKTIAAIVHGAFLAAQ